MQLQQFAHISIIQNHPNNKGDIYVYWILLKILIFSTYSYQLKKLVTKFVLKLMLLF